MGLTQIPSEGNGSSIAKSVDKQVQQVSVTEPSNILIVDDEPRNLDVLESILASPNYCLLRAGSAEQALMLLIDKPIAVMVLDVRMPGMDGLELAQLIKQRKKSQSIPIIFLTAYYQEDAHILQGYSVGAVDYLIKPTNPVILRSKVAAFVEIHQAQQRLHKEVLQRQRAEEAQQRMADRLRALAAELTRTEQSERKRLASLLHDHLQQLLVGGLMQLNSLVRPVDASLKAEVESVRATFEEALEASRSLTFELSPPVLSQSGLKAGLIWLANRSEEKFKIKINVQASDESEPHEEATRFLLFDCARELLFNSIKHSGSASIDLCLERGKDDWISICVQDYGKGFDQTQLQGAATTGFGLFSIQQRLEYLGGRLLVESSVGQGTKSVILVPPDVAATIAEVSQVMPSTSLPSTSTGTGESGRKIRIILADDHRIVLQGLKKLLETEQDLEIVGTAMNGHEAVQLAYELRPHLVVMDISMPVMNGIEATRIITKDLPSIKVVGLSMNAGKEVTQAMLEAGATTYLVKGGPIEDLVAAIRANCKLEN